MYLANFQEDTMTELYDEFNNMEIDYTYENKSVLYSCLNNAPKPHRALLLGALDIEENCLPGDKILKIMREQGKGLRSQ